MQRANSLSKLFGIYQRLKSSSNHGKTFIQNQEAEAAAEQTHQHMSTVANRWNIWTVQPLLEARLKVPLDGGFHHCSKCRGLWHMVCMQVETLGD